MKNIFKNPLDYFHFFFKWLIFSVFVGILGGIVGALFHKCLDYVTHLRMENTFLIYFLPLGGLLIVLLYRFFKNKGDLDTDRVIKASHKDGDIPLVLMPLIFISTSVTHLFGGSAGREGAALQIGGSLGNNIGKLFSFSENDMHIVTMTGMSSVFASVFMTPVTAAVFVLEVASVGTFNHTAFLPCIIAGGVSYFISSTLGNVPMVSLSLTGGAFDVSLTVKIIILAFLCAVLSIIFCMAIKKSKVYLKKLFKNEYLRIFIGGCIVVLLTILCSNYDYNGAGTDVIQKALSGSARPYDFILKLLFTAITLGAGFKGGEIVPSFFIGATFGCAVSALLGTDPVLSACIAMVAVFCGVVNCPLASLVLSCELFGTGQILYFAIALAVTYIFSGYASLYREQSFIYSKNSSDLL